MNYKTRLILMVLSCVMLSVSYPTHGASLATSGRRIDKTELQIQAGASGRKYRVFGDVLLPEDDQEKLLLGGTLWPEAIVYYSFHSSVDQAVRQLVINQMVSWETDTPIDFRESSTALNRILIQMGDTAGCGSSPVGIVGGVQDLILECANSRTIAHELGHALGFDHEHQRRDRNSFVRIIDQDNMQAACPMTWSVNFGLQSGRTLSAYDYVSVMHYQSSGTITCGGAARRVLFEALGGQPPGPPTGSELSCTSATQCTQLMGGNVVSQRDRYAAALAYAQPSNATALPPVTLNLIINRFSEEKPNIIWRSGFE